MRRRAFLRLGLGAAAWPAALAAQDRPRGARSVIWLWMAGGPSQGDTWDPKPGGAESIETPVAGLRISALLPRCAAQAGRLAIIRSMTVELDTHEGATEMMHTGRVPYPRPAFGPVGTLLCAARRQDGAPAPRFISIEGPEVPTVDVFAADDLPFRIRDVGAPLPGPSLLEAPARARLLADLDAEWARTRPGAPSPGERADRLLSSPMLRAFDAREEPEALRKEYGGAFGRKCLVARRLVEAGCTFVEVGLGGWDTHRDHDARVRALCAELDPGMGTLVRDLADRGLLERTLVVCCGEFGRAREPNAEGGREHWTRGFSAVLAGGTIQGGRVHGDTGPDGKDCRNPVPPGDFLATVWKACGAAGQKYHADGHTWTPVPHGARPVASLF